MSIQDEEIKKKGGEQSGDIMLKIHKTENKEERENHSYI